MVQDVARLCESGIVRFDFFITEFTRFRPKDFLRRIILSVLFFHGCGIESKSVILQHQKKETKRIPIFMETNIVT